MANNYTTEKLQLPIGPFQEQFSIEYEFEDKTSSPDIDAELLAASIQGLSTITKRIAKESFNIDIDVNVSAHKEGCFEVLITIFGLVSGAFSILSWAGYDYQKTVNIFSRFFIKDFDSLKRHIETAGGDVEALLSKINESSELSSAEKVCLTRLVLDRKFQTALEEFTRILDHKKVSEISLVQDKERLSSIAKTNRQAFILVNPEEVTTTNKELKLRIVYLSPTETIWQFRANKYEFWAEIKDDLFLERTKRVDIKTIKDTIYNAHVTTISTRKRGANRSSLKHYVTTISVDTSGLLLTTA